MDERDEEDEGPSSAEQAFDNLRAEVAAMRRALQGLGETFKKLNPVDYTETLGAIAKRLEILGSTVAAIEQHPAIRMTPAQHQRAISAAGEELVHKSIRTLDLATSDAVKERRELAAIIGAAREQDRQLKWLLRTGGIAVLCGLLASPIFARLLPFGWDGEVAAFIMGADRWRAGGALMEAANPRAWSDLQSAAALLEPNKAALADCRLAAAKTKKEQRCSVVVPAM